MLYGTLKEGDKVLCVDAEPNPNQGWVDAKRKIEKQTYTVKNDYCLTGNPHECIELKELNGGWYVKRFVSAPTNTNNIMTKLVKKFKLLTKGEPERSFIEKGIMNDDETLTTDGQALFNAYLLQRFGAEFKTDVVDKIEVEIEKQHGSF